MRRRHGVVGALVGVVLAGGVAAAVRPGPSAGRSYPPKTVPGVLADPQPALTTLCAAGYTATIRPPQSYTTALKVKQMAAWHLAGTSSDFEEDHLVPLELGGHPTSPFNLWPEPWNGPGGAHAKDVEENSLHRAVCAGTMLLVDAQRKIVVDWGPR